MSRWLMSGALLGIVQCWAPLRLQQGYALIKVVSQVSFAFPAPLARCVQVRWPGSLTLRGVLNWSECPNGE